MSTTSAGARRDQYELSFQVIAGGATHTFESAELLEEVRSQVAILLAVTHPSVMGRDGIRSTTSSAWPA